MGRKSVTCYVLVSVQTRVQVVFGVGEELAQRFAADADTLNDEKPFRWSYGSMKFARTPDGKPAFSDFQAFAHLTERGGGGQKIWSPAAKIPDPAWGQLQGVWSG